MRRELASLLRAPGSTRHLELAVFRNSPLPDGAAEVAEGVLFDARQKRAYPILDGVPVMFDDAFPEDFLRRHGAALAAHPVLSELALRAGSETRWSFAREWQEHFDADSERTWGYTPQERLEQALLETETERAWFRDKLVLDAGCGNGGLSQELARLGALVVGLDYSSTVRGSECLRRAPDVLFVQGDLESPPLAEEAFDLVISIGVLHHTRDTARTFRAVARLVKPHGRLYVWLYRRPERFVGRYLKDPLYAVLRSTVARLASPLQSLAVRGYARLVWATHRALGRGRRIPFREYLVSAYDDLTPRWRHQHTPIEVGRWFHEAGFGPPTLTHWDNPYGFGLLAERRPCAATPGVHFGAGEKLWDDETTLLGRLHAE